MNIIDLVAILPFYLQLGPDMRTIRALRLLRAFRVLKLARYSRAMDTLTTALKQAAPELCVTAFMATIVIVVASMGAKNEKHP